MRFASSVPDFPATVFAGRIFLLRFLKQVLFLRTSEPCVCRSLGSKCLSFFPARSHLSMPPLSFSSLPMVYLVLSCLLYGSHLTSYILLAMRLWEHRSHSRASAGWSRPPGFALRKHACCCYSDSVLFVAHMHLSVELACVLEVVGVVFSGGGSKDRR